MANYTQYIPQVNSTTYPVSINNCFTALTTDVTALENEIETARDGEPDLLAQLNLKLNLTGGTLTGSVIFTGIPAFNGGTSGTSAPFTVDSTQVVTNLNADLLDGQEGNWYAPIASPIFTGNPSIPTGTTGITQSAGDNSVKIATTEYIENANAGLNTKIIDIGDWNMDTVGALLVVHGLTLSSIRTVEVIIRDDDDTAHFNFIRYDLDSTTDSFVTATATHISLTRSDNGNFDSINFDATLYNRGWITIQYVA